MAASNPPGPDPDNQVVSVSTTDVYTELDPGAEAPIANPPAPSGQPVLAGATEAAVDANEPDVWFGGYAMGNFAGRFILGSFLILVTALLVYAKMSWEWPVKMLAQLSGLITACFWVWLLFRIVRARMSHQYRLTTRRLFVTAGIFRRDQQMMELEHLKEVSIRHQKFLDHIFNIATVVVTSEVQGAPTLFLLGVKNPQQVMDQIYHQARG